VFEHRGSQPRVFEHRLFEHRVFEHEPSEHGFLSMMFMAQGKKASQSESQGRSPLPLEPLV